jgi:hypothetical protein
MTNDEYPYRSPADAQTWQPAWPSAAPLAAEAVAAEALAAEPEPDRTLGWIIAVALAVLAGGNLAMLPTAELLAPPIRPGFLFSLGISFVCFAAGSIVGQGALLAILVVWGSGPLWQRLAWQAALMGLGFWAWGLGYSYVVRDRVLAWDEGELAAVLCLPFLVLSCQAVPWFLRLFLQWRIEREFQSPPTTASLRAERLSIRDYLVGTVLVAVTLHLVRAGKPTSMPEASYWSLWLTIGLVLAVLGLIAVAPIVYFTLGTRRASWGVVGVLTLTGLACAPAIHFLRGVPLPPVPLIFAIPALIGGITLPVAVPLWIARRHGYRLVTRRTDFQSVQTTPSSG